MTVWRLLDTPPMTAAENMALDETLVELKGKGKTPDTIHFLQFSPRCVLVGYHQSVEEEVRVDYCMANNIEINRRNTGGGALFFDENQLGWEVISSKSFFDVKLPNLRLFKRLCAPVVEALRILGVESDFRPRNDIEVNGRKISGTGGTDSDDAFLFQGTMLVDFDVDTMLRSLRIPVEKLKAKEIDSVKERVTCLNWELGHTPSLSEIKDAVAGGFEKELGITLEPGGLTESEKDLFREKLEYYRSNEWIYHVNPRYQKKEVIQSAYKADSGLVRFTMAINKAQKRIKDIFITGDFLSFPSRALFDMESSLRGLRLDRGLIHGIIREYFEKKLITIPGMSFEDFLKPVDQILQKIAISEYDIPIEHCNKISVTNGTFEEILKDEPSLLLLPYCSKLTSCELRYKKECRACGKCTIGTAWEMGKEKKMKTVCIVSFEDLWEELLKMKAKGVTSYIGCCCQPFFTKHVDDFEKAGLPGILLDIDSTTCYELDQAKDAYAGSFSSQTEVNLDLLNTVLNTDVSRSC